MATTGPAYTGTCTLCKSSATLADNFDNDSRLVVCKTCGKYVISQRLREGLEAHGPTTSFSALTIATRTASEADGPTLLTNDTESQLRKSVIFPKDPLETADEVLVWLGNRTHLFGQSIPFNRETDYPLFRLRAATELRTVVDFMVQEMRWVKHAGNMGTDLIIDTAGWRRLRELEQTALASRQAFVAMRFNDEMFAVYDAAIQPAIYEAGFDAFIVSRADNNNPIDDEIIAAIRRSRFIVADFTHIRTPVFFEAGYGLGHGLDVIWTVREDYFEPMKEHFDTRQYPYIIWKDTTDLKQQLSAKIFATIDGAVARAPLNHASNAQ